MCRHRHCARKGNMTAVLTVDEQDKSWETISWHFHGPHVVTLSLSFITLLLLTMKHILIFIVAETLALRCLH